MEEVAREFAGQVEFYKVDIEDAEDVAVAYQVYQVPVLLFFRDGSPTDKLMGVVAKPKLVSRVEELVAG